MTHTEFLQRLGMELKVARIRKGIERNEMAKLTGLNKSSISAMENGKKDSHILSYKRFADAVGIELNSLISLSEKQ